MRTAEVRTTVPLSWINPLMSSARMSLIVALQRYSVGGNETTRTWQNFFCVPVFPGCLAWNAGALSNARCASHTASSKMGSMCLGWCTTRNPMAGS